MKHPPYSCDLVSNDFWLFLEIKSALKGRRFQDIEDIKKRKWREYWKLFHKSSRNVSNSGLNTTLLVGGTWNVTPLSKLKYTNVLGVKSFRELISHIFYFKLHRGTILQILMLNNPNFTPTTEVHLCHCRWKYESGITSFVMMSVPRLMKVRLSLKTYKRDPTHTNIVMSWNYLFFIK
jgi:hypothetical protein